MTQPWRASFEAWIASGARVEVALPAGRRVDVFVRVEGQGPWLTALHGFPTCSLDWARVVPLVKHRFRTLCFDFPGYGDSDKPPDADYGIDAQADCAEAVWRLLGVQYSYVLAHDLGGTICVELLRRHGERALDVGIPGVLMTNCALYPEAYRPVLAQRLLLTRGIGPLFSRLVSWRIFRKEYGSIFAPGREPGEEQLVELWKSILHRRGKRNYHRLIRYVPERIRERARWEPVPGRTEVPVRYLWGMLDPIEGRPMMELMRRRIPSLDARELDDVGHCPHLEAPEIVAEESIASLDRSRERRGA